MYPFWLRLIDFLGCYRPLRLAWKSNVSGSTPKMLTTTRANWLYNQSTKTFQGMEYSNQCFRNAPGSSIDCKPMVDPIGSGCCLLLHFLLTKPITGSKVNMPTMFDLKLQQINPECSGTRAFVIYQPQQRQPQLATKQCLAMSMCVRACDCFWICCCYWVVWELIQQIKRMKEEDSIW